MRIQKTLISKCLLFILPLLLFAGCQTKPTAFAEKMGNIVGCSSIGEAAKILGLSEDTLTEKKTAEGVTYSLSPCSTLLPDGFSADNTELYLDMYQGEVISVQQTAVVEGTPDEKEVYQTMKELCSAIQAVYPESAFADIHEGIVAVNGEAPAPFTEKYVTEEDFAEDFSEVLDADLPVLTTEEAWWVSKEDKIVFTLSLRLTSGGAVYTWTAYDYEAQQAFYAERMRTD